MEEYIEDLSEARFHSAAALFPPLQEAEYRRLSEDIAKNGLLEEIVVYDERILDGRHRLRACLENHIKPRFVKYDGTDPVEFVLSRNLHRRHLSASQRALRLLNWRTRSPAAIGARRKNAG
jgi:ParB-like chromosome segregation protein Spo0J